MGNFHDDETLPYVQTLWSTIDSGSDLCIKVPTDGSGLYITKVPTLLPTDESSPETLSLFHLPDVVLRMLFKKYIPVSTKAHVLCNMEEFATILLADHSLWFKRSLAFFNLIRYFKPGLYYESGIQNPSLTPFYYVIVDDETYTIQINYIKPLPYKTFGRRCIEKTQRNHLSIGGCLSRFKKKVVHLGFETVSLYHLDRSCPFKIGFYKDLFKNFPLYYLDEEYYFWIDHSQNSVKLCWDQRQVYFLKDNECDFYDDYKLTVQKDHTVLLTCTRGYSREDVMEIKPLSFHSICSETLNNLKLNHYSFTVMDSKNVEVCLTYFDRGFKRYLQMLFDG